MKLTNNGLSAVLCIALATGAVATFTGCASTANERSTGQYIDDKSLTMRVHDALGDNSDYKFSNVDVNVYRGTVQLSGFVDNSDQKSKAADIARGVQGVQNVVNNITVNSQSSQNNQ